MAPPARVGPSHWRSLCTLLFTLALPSTAHAEQVTPNERVQSHLRVRAEPNGTAAIVGFLERGEFAPWVATTGAWREIVFEGAPAYVASSYSQVVPDAAAGNAVVSIRLGAWNIKKLGHGGNKDFSAVASVIEDHFDLLVMVEVMQKEGAHAGYDQLMTALGSEWSGQITASPRPNTTSSNSEFYAIVWRAPNVRPCAGWTELRHHADNDGSGSSTLADHFSREPAFGCFEFGPAGSPTGDLLLAAYHATFQSGAAIDAEIRQLGAVFHGMQAANPAERDLVIAGDFNRMPSQLASLLPTFADRTTGIGSTLNHTGALTANLYDHLLVFDESATSEMQGNAQVLDIRNVATSNAVFFSTVSDHLPIVVTLQAVADDD